VSTFGDVALAPSDPQIVYAGTGEENNRQSTSWGNGVYRSDDGGETWRHLGLDDTHHIARIQVHPTNPDVAYVAALGNLWASTEDRGVYRTTDGGATWSKVLFIDEHTGAVELAMDPATPEMLYAAMYQRQRRAWGFNGGGPGSGLYKTTDGGENWTELTNGIPEGDKGRIGLGLAASNPQVLNATIEHADRDQQGTYRTEDGGATWERVNGLNIRPMYYSHVFIDPTNEDRVYLLATSSNRSEDGGRNFVEIAERPTYDVGVHADHHGLWIDPNDPAHLYLVGDAGLHESYDYGESWRKLNNFVTAQFYAIGVDMRSPYYVYGGLQDNHSFAGPSETRRWIGIVNDDWKQTGFGDGMYWQPNPFDTTQAYGSSNGGNYFRLHTLTGDMLDISPVPPPGEDYRFDWTSPALASRHDANTVYVAGNRLFTSHDRGESWTRSEDLSRQIERDTLEIMGVRGADITLSRNDGAGSFGEAVTLAESPVDAAVLWVGFDDGNLQVSRDGGATWTEVSGNVPDLPEGTYVGRIATSVRSAGTAYAAFDAHRDGDFRPFLYRTDDFGATWQPLHGALPSGSVLSLAEHPDNPDLLFAGTEHALFTSTDGGNDWVRVPGLPTTAYDDLVIHPREKDLVMGTHGRGIWILDDTRPLAAWNEATTGAPAHLFAAGPATIFLYWKDTSYRADGEYAGENPPDGALITYRLGEGDGPAALRVTNAAGEVVRELAVPSSPGMHRVDWDLRWGLEEGTETWEPWEHPKLPRPIGGRGPWVSPGVYTLTLEARGTTTTQQLEVLADPLVPELTAADYRDREAFMVGLVELRREIQALMDNATGDRQDELRSLVIEVQRVFGSLSGGGVRPGTIHPPTAAQRARIERVRAALAEGGS
jgi:photosystem II stability/assembly factor-like uncharacterized protein